MYTPCILFFLVCHTLTPEFFLIGGSSDSACAQSTSATTIDVHPSIIDPSIGAERFNCLLNVLSFALTNNMTLPPWASAVIAATKQRNGHVVETSPPLAAMVRSNTNGMFLGSAVAARDALFYLVKYLTKPVTPLAHAATLLYDTLKHFETYANSANENEEDAGSRMIKSVLQRLVNGSCGMVELGAHLAIFLIFEGKRFESTHDFRLVNPYGAIFAGIAANENAAASRLLASPSIAVADAAATPIVAAATPAIGLDEDDIGTDNIAQLLHVLSSDGADYPQVPDDAACNPGHLGNDSDFVDFSSHTVAGTKLMYTLLDKTLFFASNAELYANRGEKLKNMSFYMWSTLITVIKRPEGILADDDLPELADGNDEHAPARNGAGRPTNALFPFPEQHTLFVTHIQRLNSLQPLLIAVGASPPKWPGPMLCPPPPS
jgi:hypothetical protein